MVLFFGEMGYCQYGSMSCDDLDSSENTVSVQTETILDITEMPLEGIAAYWLSLKKLMGAKFTAKVVQDEAERTEEPFIRFILETMTSDLSDEYFRHVLRLKEETSLRTLTRKLELMREGLLSIAIGENPRKGLVRMAAHFASTAMPEEKISRMALEMVKKARAGGGTEYAVTIDNRMPADQLLVKLMFYVFWARHEGTGAIDQFAENSRCLLFREGLGLVSDGFDRSFVKACMDTRLDGILREVRLKMDMAAELAIALRTKHSYEDMLAVAQAYMA